jgi:hypothetical protein
MTVLLVHAARLRNVARVSSSVAPQRRARRKQQPARPLAEPKMTLPTPRFRRTTASACAYRIEVLRRRSVC